MSNDPDQDVALAKAVELLSENHQRIIEEQRLLARQHRALHGLLFVGLALLFAVVDEGAVYADMPWLAWAFGAIGLIVLVGVVFQTLRDAYAKYSDYGR